MHHVMCHDTVLMFNGIVGLFHGGDFLKLAKGMESVNGMNGSLFAATWDDGMDDTIVRIHGTG